VLNGSIPAEEILSMAEDSYRLVVDSLPKRLQQNLGG